MKSDAVALQAERRILLLRSQGVMLDFHLAELYGVQTKALNQAVKRNLERFPEDFAFQLTPEEDEALRSQIVTSKPRKGSDRPQTAAHAPGRGGRRYLPYAFTEQGVAVPLSRPLFDTGEPGVKFLLAAAPWRRRSESTAIDDR